MPGCKSWNVDSDWLRAARFLAAIVLAGMVGQANAKFIFPGEIFPVGNTIVGAVSADLNSDGHPDLVTINYADNTVSVLLGNGDGTFQAQKVYTVGNGPVEVVVVDINGDGKPDIITSNTVDRSVSILLGNGDGTFQPSQNILVPVADLLSVADVNGDSNPDIIVAGDNISGKGDGKVTVLPGNGDGTFQSPITTNVSYADSLDSLELADVNLDGKLDVVLQVSYFDDSLNEEFLKTYFASGNGDGTFAAPVLQTGSMASSAVVQADMNNDGKQEVLSMIRENYVPVIKLLGISPNSARVYTGSPNLIDGRLFSGVLATVMRPIDFDGDGKLDLFLLNSTLLRSDYKYAPSLLVDSSPNGGTSEIVFNDGNGDFQLSGNFGDFIAAADLNGDGKADAISANNNELIVSPGNGDGSFQLKYGQPPSGLEANVYNSVTTVADLNGDGLLDFLITGTTYLPTGNPVNLHVSLQGWDYAFKAVPTTFDVGQYPVAMNVSDLNGDGKLDVVTANNNDNTLSVLLGNGDGTFGTAMPYAVGGTPTNLVAADTNNDKNLDLIVTNSGNNTVAVLLGNGDGTFQTRTTYAVGTLPTAVAAADVNNDNKTDLIVSNSTDSTVSVLLGNGDGTFQSQVTYNVGAKPLAVATADLRGVKKQDIVVANSGTSNISVLLGNGDGTFQSQQTYPVGHQPVNMALKDVDGDGNLDVVTVNSDDTISVLLGNGDGTFQNPRSFIGNSGSADNVNINAADIDNDGVVDAVDNNTILYGFTLPPSAWDAHYTTTQDVPVTGTLRASSPVGKPLTFIVAKPNQGTVTTDSAGAFTYTPSSTYTGTAYFKFVVTDGTHVSRDATIYINIPASSSGSSSGGTGGSGGGGSGGGSTGGSGSGNSNGSGGIGIVSLFALVFCFGRVKPWSKQAC